MRVGGGQFSSVDQARIMHSTIDLGTNLDFTTGTVGCVLLDTN